MSDLFEEGEFDNCADVLDDWFNSCNIQGVAEMETVEINELIECMRDIEKRKQTKVEGLTADRNEIRRQYIAEAKETDRLQAKVDELTAENNQLNTDLRIALSVQGANGFNLSLKEIE